MRLHDGRQAPEHLGVDDRLQGGALLRVLEGPGGDGPPVQPSVGPDDVLPEQLADPPEGGSSRLKGPPGQLIRIDDHRTAFAQHPGHRRLAGADPAGQADQDQA
jgi:hypothetical protein